MSDRIAKHIETWRRDPEQFVIDTLGARPDNVQSEILRRIAAPHAMVSVESAHGIGKENCYSLELDTPSGKRLWGSLQPGDALFGVDGYPTIIEQRHEQGVKPIYKVAFSDGSSTLAGLEHIWRVKGYQQRRNNRDWMNLTTAEIIAQGVTRSNGVARAKQWEIPSYAPVQYPEADLKIHPYVLGCWMGDGSKGSGQIANADSQVWEEIKNLGYTYGPLYKNLVATVKGLQTLLKEEGIFGCTTYTVSVPDKYKYASIEQRLAILQGILDTDGWVEKSGSINLGSTSPQLAKDATWLARSLGMLARDSGPFEKYYRDEGGNKVIGKPFYISRITWDGHTKLFRLDRKQNLLKDPQKRYKTRWIASIEYSHDEEAMCVTVSNPDGLYLLNDFIVTHNTCVSAWIALWNLGCFKASKTPVTSVTKDQLSGVFWAELSRWYDDWELQGAFERTKTKIEHRERADYWWIRQRTWSSENLDALMGIHSPSNLFIFDEASGIPTAVYEFAEGSMFKQYSRSLLIGNPIHNTGYFYDSLHTKAKMTQWSGMSVSCFDSEVAMGNDPDYPSRMAESYGEDSNNYRIRVLGKPPNTEDDAVIDSKWIHDAVGNDIPVKAVQGEDIFIGVDPARFGSNPTGIIIRQGRKVIYVKEYYRLDTMQIAGVVHELKQDYPEAIINVDTIGVGAGVADRLRSLGHQVNDIVVAESPNEKVRFNRKRDEVWWELRDWLKGGGVDIPNDEQLISELSAPRYAFTNSGKIQVESKDDLQKRNIPSPNLADALCLTLAGASMAGIVLI